MRLALRHQIILAPAAVLLLMTLLLVFLQFKYWELSIKRQESRRLGTLFISLAEADLASQRIHGVTMNLSRDQVTDIDRLEEISQLHFHLQQASTRILSLMPLPDGTRALLQQCVADLDPESGFDQKRFFSALSVLRPQLASLAEKVQKDRGEQLHNVHQDNIDELVARTALVSILVLGASILLGIFLSLTFARRILRRIQVLSESAGRIARGELIAPPAPARVQDELDILALSISHMTDRLIRVVSTEKLLEGAEDERRRIAMDIHDQTLADLSSILRRIQDLKRKGDLQAEAPELEEDLHRTITNLREVMEDLHPQTLEILGIGAALQSHLERHKGDLPNYHFSCAPEAEATPLSASARLALYRIAVEAIHNVIKHAGANRFEISLDRQRETLIMAVEDNGRGFDPQGAGSGGRGMNNIRARARAIGAAVDWSPSRFSSGTRFELSLTVPNRPAEG